MIILIVGVLSVQLLLAKGFRFKKERLDLKAPLPELNQTRLLPYRLVGSDRIPKEEVEALGTDEYIRWRLQDTSVSRDDPFHWVTLFVTYYSGQPDQVPHVPEECFLGGGYQQLANVDSAVKVPALGDGRSNVPVRMLTFKKDSAIGGAWAPTVIYLFSVNGEFVASRNSVRWALSNPLQRYGYFSKVEVSYGQQEGQRDSQQNLKAAERLLNKVLPALVEDHWPNWPPGGPTTEPASSGGR